MESPLELFRDRRVWLLLAAALGLRLVVALDLWASDPLVRVLLSDPAYYDEWARVLAAGEAFRPGRPYWLPPLYPHALGVLYRLTGGERAVTLAVQLALGVAATVGVVRIADVLAGRRAALWSGWLWTLYLPVVFFETRLLAINAALPLAVLALAFLVRPSGSRPSPRSAAAAGLALGLACLARPNLLLAVPACAAALALGRARLAAVVLVVAAGLAVLPCAVRNRVASGEWVLVTANGGVNFWFGNNPQAHGTFHAPGPEWGAIAEQRAVSVALASEAEERPLGDAEASSHWFGRGLEWIASEPMAALRLAGLKLADTLTSTELGIQYVPTAVRRDARSLWLLPVPAGLLLALGVLGLREVRPRGLLAAWLAAGLAASLLYFTYSRFRVPILVAWMPFAGAGAARAVDALRGRAHLPLPAVAASVALLVVSFVPFEGAYPRQLAANAMIDAAGAWSTLGEPDRARALLERSLATVETNPKARVALGRLALARGDERAAREHLLAAWAMPGAFPPALLELARLELAAADPELRAPAEAVARLRAFVRTTPPANPYRQRAAVLLASGLFDHPELESSPGEARALVEQALARDPDDAAARIVSDALDARDG